MLHHYEDLKCTWGYMTLCNECKKRAPRWVNVEKEVKGFPYDRCEMCGAKSMNKVTGEERR